MVIRNRRGVGDDDRRGARRRPGRDDADRVLGENGKPLACSKRRAIYSAAYRSAYPGTVATWVEAHRPNPERCRSPTCRKRESTLQTPRLPDRPAVVRPGERRARLVRRRFARRPAAALFSIPTARRTDVGAVFTEPRPRARTYERIAPPSGDEGLVTAVRSADALVITRRLSDGLTDRPNHVFRPGVMGRCDDLPQVRAAPARAPTQRELPGAPRRLLDGAAVQRGLRLSARPEHPRGAYPAHREWTRDEAFQLPTSKRRVTPSPIATRISPIPPTSTCR
jgi:hypothetical protein